MFGLFGGYFTFHHPRDLKVPVDSPSSGHSGDIIFPCGGVVEVKSFDQKKQGFLPAPFNSSSRGYWLLFLDKYKEGQKSRKVFFVFFF